MCCAVPRAYLLYKATFAVVLWYSGYYNTTILQYSIVDPSNARAEIRTTPTSKSTTKARSEKKHLHFLWTASTKYLSDKPSSSHMTPTPSKHSRASYFHSHYYHLPQEISIIERAGGIVHLLLRLVKAQYILAYVLLGRSSVSPPPFSLLALTPCFSVLLCNNSQLGKPGFSLAHRSLCLRRTLISVQ